MDFSHNRSELSKRVDEEFVHELERVALHDHQLKHQRDEIEEEARIELIKDSFSSVAEEELSKLVQQEEQFAAQSGEYTRISEQMHGGEYGGGSSGSHGNMAVFSAPCCGERIVASQGPSGKITSTNLSEQARQYQAEVSRGGSGYGGSSSSGDYGSGGGQEDGGYGRGSGNYG